MIKNFFKKDNYIWVKLIIAAILSIILAIVFEYTVYRIVDPNYISKNRMMLFAIGFMFILIHLFLD